MTGGAKFEDMPDVLSADEAAALLRCDANTVRESVKSGELPGVRLGRKGIIRIAKSAILDALAGHKKET